MSGWQKYVQDAISGGEIIGGAATGNPALAAQGGMSLASNLSSGPAKTGGASPGPLGTPAPGLAGLGTLASADPTGVADPSGALGGAQQTAQMVGGQPAAQQQQQQDPSAAAAPQATDPYAALNNPYAGSAAVGDSYLNYMLARRLRKMKNQTAYASEHSSAGGPGIAGLQLPQMQTQLPQL